MNILGEYSFNQGREYIHKNFPELFKEITKVIQAVDLESCKSKTSKEKTMLGKLLYSPPSLNRSFKREFDQFGGWKNHKEYCQYPTEYYINNYIADETKNAYRDMDFVKQGLGVEVQFGKYSFMVYNVCAKMTIFKNLGVISAGVEIVPIKDLAKNMSTGVSYFEQFVWDLEARGVADIDIPVLILGIGE